MIIKLLKKKLEKRLEELQQELEFGQKMLAETEEKKANLKSSLLRIKGAIQELEDIIYDLDKGEINEYD